MKLLDLFSGMCGFSHAAERHGFVTTAFCEIDKFCHRVIQHHYPDKPIYTDIRNVDGGEIEPVNVVTFGSPCQNLSMAGKQEGLQGEQSCLFHEAIRIIREMREKTNGSYPRYAVWENVPGAFSSNKRQDFRAVLEEITETEIPMPKSGKWANAGMVRGNGRSVAWRVLDAQYWGVPQRRRRIFLVADFRGQSAPEILFECKGVPGDSSESGKTGEEVAAGVGDGIERAIRIAPFNSGQVTSPQNGNRVEFGLPCHTLSANEHPPSIIISNAIASNGRQGTVSGRPSHTVVSRTIAFAQNQREEVRNLQDKAGALPAEPGMHQQTFIAQPTAFDPYNSAASGISPTLGTNCGMPTGRNILFEPRSHDGVPRIHSDVCPTLNTMQGGQREPCIAQCLTTGTGQRYDMETETLLPIGFMPHGYGGYKKGVGMLRRNGGDLGGGSETLAMNHLIRRLTPLECLRLQGFPDDWLDGMDLSDSAKYRMIGNSIAIPCVEFIMRRITECDANA